MLVVSFDLKAVLKYLRPFIDRDAFAKRDNSSGYPYSCNHAKATKVAKYLHEQFGFKSDYATGVTKLVFLHRTCVLKIPIHSLYAPMTSDEIDYINTQFPKKYQKHFPFTLDVGNGISIQELCPTSDTQFWLKRINIQKLAFKLKIFDVHTDNIGFGSDGNFKFIDVQSRSNLARVSTCDEPEVIKFYNRKRKIG